MAYFDFTGKTVLVTGASRGIGYGVARGFADAGATVHILSSGQSINDAAEQLGENVTGHICDISDCARVSEVIEGLSGIDVLINNAGLERPTPMYQSGQQVEETFRRIIDVNIMGTFFVTRQSLRKMKNGGRIIITSSIWGKTAVPEFSAYCASKHANIGFMRSLAQELAVKEITVNAVCPGWVRTDGAMRSLKQMAQRDGRSEDKLLDEITSAQALPGLMEPDDMASTYLFLASAAASNITGQTLNVDRGELMS